MIATKDLAEACGVLEEEVLTLVDAISDDPTYWDERAEALTVAGKQVVVEQVVQAEAHRLVEEYGDAVSFFADALEWGVAWQVHMEDDVESGPVGPVTETYEEAKELLHTLEQAGFEVR